MFNNAMVMLIFNHFMAQKLKYMKAKIYIKNYLSDFQNRCFNEIPIDEIKTKSGELAVNILSEFHEICKARGIKKGSTEIALVNVIKEFNHKWKIICFGVNNFFEKTFDISVLKTEGFLELFKASEHKLEYLIDMYCIK